MVNQPSDNVEKRIEADPDERWERSASFVAADGKPVGQAELDFEDEIVAIGKHHYKKLKRLVVTPPQGGEPIDILGASSVAGRINIWVPGKATASDNMYRRSNITMARPIENHMSIVVLMHEMRHAEQEHEGGQWSENYRMSEDLRSGWGGASTPYFEYLFKAFPGLQRVLEADPAFVEYRNKLRVTEEGINKIGVGPPRNPEPLRKAMARSVRNGIGAAMGRWRNRPHQPELPPEPPEDPMEQYERLAREQKALNETFNTDDIVNIPLFALEWDANKKALARARSFKEKGVDLLDSCMIHDEKGGMCVADIEKELDRAITIWIRNQKERKVPYPERFEDIFEIYKK